MKKKTINLTKFQQTLLKLIILISAPILTNLLTPSLPTICRIIETILVAIIIFIYIRKKDFSQIKIKEFIISLFFAMYALRFISTIHIEYSSNLIATIIAKTGMEAFMSFFILCFWTLSIPAASFYIYIFITNILSKVREKLKTLTKIEKRFLVTMCIIGMVLTIGVRGLTSAFSSTHTVWGYDIVYTADNATIIGMDAYMNNATFDNDLRQPLFTAFAMPFAIPAHMLSEFLPFNHNLSYQIVMTIIQFILISITTIMLARLLNLEETKKKYLYILLSISFPYILFSFLIEQYVIALFYLILTIYLYKEDKGINYSYIGAVGTLLTSGIIFPLITKSKALKDKIRDVFKCFIAFCSIFIIFGGGGTKLLSDVLNNIAGLLTHSGQSVALINKLQQFTHFISSLFIGPRGEEIINHIGFDSWQIQPITTFSILGIVILILCIISAIINRKEYITKVSFLWIIFSIIMLVLLGWGTEENGLILYSLYFGWAYFVLIFQLLTNIFKNNKIFKIAFIILILLMVIGYTPELFNIFKFAILNY